MRIEVDLTDQEAFELHTFIRRSIFEDYIRAMDEANQDTGKTHDRVYTVEGALGKIREQIAKEWDRCSKNQ